jgi:MFS family permease
MSAANPRKPTESSESRGRLSATLRAMRHRNFQLFFSGQLISLVGTWMDTVAEAWLIYRLTGSSLLLGTVAFCSQIPVFLMAPIGGFVADKFNRRDLIVVTQSLSMVLAGTLAFLTLTHKVQVWHVMLLAALLGVVNAFDIPGRQAFIVEMVGKEDLMNAIALNSSMFNGARIIGPAVAGVLVAKIGEGWCFAANSASYIAVITGLLLMRVQRRRITKSGTALQNVAEGFGFVRKTAPIRALLMLLALVSVMGMPYAVLMPIFADRILHGGARGLGILMGASGVGALIGALSLAAKNGLKGLGQWVALASGGFGVSLILFSISRSFWLSAALLVPVGYCMMTQMASSNTLIQAMVPDRLRGRVMAVYSMGFMGMAPIGALLAGVAAQHLGAPATVAIGGVVCIAGAGLFGYKLPAIRVTARQLIIAQNLAGGDPEQEFNAPSATAAE